MKLTATHDRWERSQVPSLDEEQRGFERAQAAKHAQDVCRIVAMTTMDERDHADEVLSDLADREEFQIAAEVWRCDFGEKRIPAVVQAISNWRPDDFEVLNGVLGTWFG